MLQREVKVPDLGRSASRSQRVDEIDHVGYGTLLGCTVHGFLLEPVGALCATVRQCYTHPLGNYNQLDN